MSHRLLFALLAFCFAVATAVAQDAGFKSTEDVVYSRKFGTALPLDVFQPAKTNNGCAVVYMVSGGWFSRKEAINAGTYKAFLDRCYTVFAVVHGAQPKFTIPEISQDIHRAVRFIRINAAKWGVNPDKFGISGACGRPSLAHDGHAGWPCKSGRERPRGPRQ